MSHVAFTSFQRLFDRAVSVVFISMGAIVAGGLAVVGG